MNANTMQRWAVFSFSFFWSGGQAVSSLPFTRPHVAAVSIIPALPFQISMSDLLMQEHKHSRSLRSVSTEQPLICMNTCGSAFLFLPPNTRVAFWNSPRGSSASLSPKECNIHHLNAGSLTSLPITVQLLWIALVFRGKRQPFLCMLMTVCLLICFVLDSTRSHERHRKVNSLDGTSKEENMVESENNVWTLNMRLHWLYFSK